MDTTHLVALQTRLSHERERLAAETNEAGKTLRRVWIRQIEKEISDEMAFLGLSDDPLPEMTDEEILKELGL